MKNWQKQAERDRQDRRLKAALRIAEQEAREKRRAEHEAVGRGIVCKRCGKPVEKSRECYAVPMCYECLPPPEIPVIDLSPKT